MSQIQKLIFFLHFQCSNIALQGTAVTPAVHGKLVIHPRCKFLVVCNYVSAKHYKYQFIYVNVMSKDKVATFLRHSAVKMAINPAMVAAVCQFSVIKSMMMMMMELVHDDIVSVHAADGKRDDTKDCRSEHAG